MEHVYRWQRRWYPRYANQPTDFSSLQREARFLATWQVSSTSRGFSFEQIQYIPCLILLGEPGIGKSHVLKEEFDKLSNSLLLSDDVCFFRDLSGANSTEYIRNLIFLSNSTYLEWLDGNHHLTIFLDSLDRTQISVDSVISVIINEIRGVDVSRLSFRIACRDYDWSISLATTLTSIWHQDPPVDDYSLVQVYQLLPLEIDDIRHAAEVNNLDPSSFLNTIRDVDVMPLATTPITLNMLLQEYPDIARNRNTLYQKGVRALCATKTDDKTVFTTRVNSRFEMVGRIAAVMILSNSYAISVNEMEGNSSPATIYVSDLLIDDESSEEELLFEKLSIPLYLKVLVGENGYISLFQSFWRLITYLHPHFHSKTS